PLPCTLSLHDALPIFTYVETRRGDLRIPFPDNFENRLTGRRVLRVWRRAKYIMADLEGGETLVIHLGMSGRITVYNKRDGRGLGDRKSTRLNSSHRTR